MRREALAAQDVVAVGGRKDAPAVEGVRVRRAFPTSRPDEYLSIRDADGKELAILESVEGLDEESALVLEAMPRRGVADPARLAAKAGLSLRTVLRRLSLLETLDLVERSGDGVVLIKPEPRRNPPSPADREDEK